MPAQLITAELVDLDVASSGRKDTVTALAQRLHAAGRVSDLDLFLADVETREAQMPTGLEGGIAIPHCSSAAVTEPSLAFGRSGTGVDFGAEDGPANLIFMVAAPDRGETGHLTVLAALARRLVLASFRDELLRATDPGAVAAFVRREVGI